MAVGSWLAQQRQVECAYFTVILEEPSLARGTPLNNRRYTEHEGGFLQNDRFEYRDQF